VGQTYVVRYPPLFSAIAGWPTLLLPPERAALAVRVLASVPAALLVTAALLAARVRRGALVGTFVATTPMVFYLASVTNPNGLEIAAALCAWSTGAVLGLSRPEDPAPAPWLVPAFGVAGLVLALVRGTSPAWLLAICLTLLAASPATVLTRVRTDPRLRRWLLVDAVAALIGVVYVLVARALEVLRPPQGVDASGFDAVRSAAGRIPVWAKQAVTDAGWLDAPAPLLTYVVWAAAGLALAWLAWRDRATRLLLVAIGLGVLAVAGSVALEASRLEEFGHGWQGRYLLPLLVGVPVLLGHGVTSARLRRVAGAILAVLVVAQVAAFWWVVRRFTVGLDGSLLARDAAWSPPLPPAVLGMVYAAAFAGLALVLLARRDERANVETDSHGGRTSVSRHAAKVPPRDQAPWQS